MTVTKRVFDETNPFYNSDKDTNLLFLRVHQNHFNDLLVSRGHVFRNEIYDALKMPRTSKGAVEGWFLADESRPLVFNIDVVDLKPGEPPVFFITLDDDGEIYRKLDDSDTPKYVDKFYEMDPETEDLIRGDELRNDMVVVIEDGMLRADTEHLRSRYDSERARANNRWCTVSSIRRRYTGDDNAIVSFIGVYEDGVKKERSFSESYCWIVKKDSMAVKLPDYIGLECPE